MLRLFARRQRASMSAYFPNSLTPPTGLGLLAFAPRLGSFSAGQRTARSPERWPAVPPRADVVSYGSRPSTRARGDDDYDVLCDGAVVGRILESAAAPVGGPWLWMLAYGQHEDRTPLFGYEPTREAAMVAFAKSWWRE
jgi:hypothetical protein